MTAGRRALRKGRDFWLESISLTPQTSASFFCQKAKNIRKRPFLCVAAVVKEVGSVLVVHGHGDGKRKGTGVCFHWWSEGITYAREWVCWTVSSGRCLQPVSSVLWKWRQVQPVGVWSWRVTCAVWCHSLSITNCCWWEMDVVCF